MTRPITLDATFEGETKDPWGGERIGFSATGKIDRRDFGLTWNLLLESGGITVGNDIKISIELEAVKVALALGGDVNAVDSKGDTAMHGAAYKQFPSVVDFLVEQGASIDVWNTKNIQGWTPLRIAVGVHRGMNFRFSKQTAAALERIMKAGVSTVVDPEAVISGATK